MDKQFPLPVESIKRQLADRFPQAVLTLDHPRNRSGVWYLDLVVDGHPVVIQWQEGKGFGVSSSPAHGYGEGADEVYPDTESTYGRVISLVLSRSFTAPPEPANGTSVVKPS